MTNFMENIKTYLPLALAVLGFIATFTTIQASVEQLQKDVAELKIAEAKNNETYLQIQVKLAEIGRDIQYIKQSISN